MNEQRFFYSVSHVLVGATKDDVMRANYEDEGRGHTPFLTCNLPSIDGQ